jgi:hypothetical protein
LSLFGLAKQRRIGFDSNLAVFAAQEEAEKSKNGQLYLLSIQIRNTIFMMGAKMGLIRLYMTMKVAHSLNVAQAHESITSSSNNPLRKVKKPVLYEPKPPCAGWPGRKQKSVYF